MKRMDVIKDLRRIKVASAYGKETTVTNAWLQSIFDLLYGIAEALDIFEDEDEG